MIFELRYYGPCVLCLGTLISKSDRHLKAHLEGLDNPNNPGPQPVCERHFEMVKQAYPNARVETIRDAEGEAAESAASRLPR